MYFGEKTRGVPQQAYYFIFAFIFLYIAFTYFGASMDLAVIVSGFVIISTFVVLNLEKVKELFVLKPKPKKQEAKVIDAEFVKPEELE